jgi:membrane protein implicated in regulation of membrane protease activity
MRSQRRGARGDVRRPYSALNLRLVLATFGLVTCAVLAFLVGRAGLTGLAVVLAVLAVVAVVDIVVIQRRRTARRREDPRARYSMFE